MNSEKYNYITVDDLIEILKDIDGGKIVNVDWNDKFSIDEDDEMINFVV